MPHYDAATYSARESVGYLIRRLYSLLHGRLERAFEGEALTFTQWIVLVVLRDGLANTAAGIARDLQHDSGALTRVIDQLEQRDMVVRRRSKQDRRAVELALTVSGRRVVQELLPIVVGHINAALAPLTSDEFERFRGYLVRILDHVDTVPQAIAASRHVTTAHAVPKAVRPARRVAPRHAPPARKRERER